MTGYTQSRRSGKSAEIINDLIAKLNAVVAENERLTKERDDSKARVDELETALLDQRAISEGWIVAATSAERQNAALVEALQWYAEQLCEHDAHSEVCGRLSNDDCFGCKARAVLAQLDRCNQ